MNIQLSGKGRFIPRVIQALQKKLSGKKAATQDAREKPCVSLFLWAGHYSSNAIFLRSSKPNYP